MSTIQELIDSGEVVLGKTKITNPINEGYYWFIPHFQVWEGLSSFMVGKMCSGEMGKYNINCIGLDWVIYHEPVEEEDRWLWANSDGQISQVFSTESWHSFTIRIESTKTKFPKEEK